jgi:hypothetical protein
MDVPSDNSSEDGSSPSFWRTIFNGGMTDRNTAFGTSLTGISDLYVIATGIGSDGSSEFGMMKRLNLKTNLFDASSNYQLQSGQNTALYSGVVSPTTGTVFLVGTARQSGSDFSILLASTDQGSTWSLRASYQYSVGNDSKSYSVTSDSSGSLYWAHVSSDGTSKHWVVTKSTNDGVSWSVVDDYQSGASLDAQPSFVKSISGTELIAGGQAMVSGSQSWLVRVSKDSGASWTTADSFQLAPGQNAKARSSKIASNGTTYYVIGEAADQSNQNQWLVRSSVDSGVTWSTYYQDSTKVGGPASGAALEIDSTGDLLMGGESTGIAGVSRWVGLRLKVENGTKTATYFEDFQLDSTQSSAEAAILRLSDDHYFSTGRAVDSYGISRWVVREYKK